MSTPEPAPQKRPEKKMYLWTLTLVVYALVIVLTGLSIWAYLYMDEKIRRERGAPSRENQPELAPKRRK